jgi:DNA-binding XRE family transcriptional regulator
MRPGCSADERRRQSEGVISGYALKVTRESLGLTQEGLAERLHVDSHTVQAWESGRRSLTATRVGSFIDVCRQLRSLGARPALVDSLGEAIEADYLLSYSLSAGLDCAPENHPLAQWVLSRSVSEMLGWPFTGEPPSALRGVTPAIRRGPVAVAPVVSREEKIRFFEHFRRVAENSVRARNASDMRQVLLRRQAYYQVGWAKDQGVGKWLEGMEREEQRRAPALNHASGWSPQWMLARSLAVARSKFGDREALWEFIRKGFGSNECELANLHYWAYWVGEIGTTYHVDSFMVEDPGPWIGAKLMQRLQEKLIPSNTCIDLYAHSLWALLKRPGGTHLLERSPTGCEMLRDGISRVLDESEMSGQSRRELEEVLGYVRWIQPGIETSVNGR